MMNNHFYITLPSDSSATYYPNNTVSHFITRLPERVRLEGPYEMALAEIIFPHTWFNVDNEDEKYWITAKERPAFVFRSGYYADGTAIATAINRDMWVDSNLKFVYNEATGKFTLTAHSTDFVMSDDLQRYLGFDLKNIASGPQTIATLLRRESRHSFDVNRGLHLMYVYCDIAAHTVVGDTKTPLLRVCNVTGRHGEMVRHSYTKPHYVPVGRREFDTIEIAINNELGKPMPFEYGKSVITLHFRRK
jgi:hypothetical protein